MDDIIFNYKSWKSFLLLVLMNLLLAYALNYLFFTDDMYFSVLGGQHTNDQIGEIIKLAQKWQWIGYILIPIVISIRIVYNSICIYTGCFLFNNKIGFNNVLRAAILSDFVFVFSGFVKLIILIFFKEIHSFDDLQFQPFSLLELFDRKTIDVVFFYPLSQINAFELFYSLMNAWILFKITKQPVKRLIIIVFVSYCIGLILWTLIVLFVSINFY